MISFLQGILASRQSDRVEVDVNGVGYEAFVSQRTLQALPPLGQAVTLKDLSSCEGRYPAVVRFSHGWGETGFPSGSLGLGGGSQSRAQSSFRSTPRKLFSTRSFTTTWGF